MTFDKPNSVPSLAEEEIAEPDAEEGVLYEEQVQPEYGILGLTLRELLVVLSWVVVFIASFFPLTSAGGATVWSTGINWILTIGVPTAAVFLVVLRRFSPQGIRRVGSLGIDQFASVAAAVSAVSWVQLLWMQIAATAQTGAFLVGWSVILAVLGALGLVATTVAAPLIPRLREDFQGRLETLAHRNANPVRPVIPRPRPTPDTEQAAPRAQLALPAGSDAAAADAQDGDSSIDSGSDPTLSDPDATRVVPRLDPAALADGLPAAAEQATDESATESPATESPATESPATESPATDVPLTDEPTHAERDDSAPLEVLNTGAVDALQEIFAERGADRPIAVPSTDTGTIEDARPDTGGPLRRDRTESARTDTPDDPADRTDEDDRGRAAYGAPAQDPFWILAQTERDVLDERGHPLFRIGPSAWTLVIEDRGGAFVVRHEDGRIGYLHDISDITKG